MPRVLVVQYSNPAVYPPVEHAALLLAEAGFEVELRGLRRLDEITIARHERIRMQLKPPAPGGWRQKAAFVRFVSWIRHEAAQIRPDWIYASDPLSTPAAWSAGAGRSVRCIYHEHDAPGSDAGSTAMRIVLAARRRVAERATICIAPSDGRAKRLSAETGRADVAVVWNVPLRREVAPPERGPRAGGGTRLLYHGSIVPARVPDTLLRALARLPRTVSCCITGYDPAGGAYQEHLRALAAELKLTDRVEFTGPIGTRQELMERCAEFDVGLSLLPLNPTDFNEQTMLGASNKPFDYLAAGLALLVPDRGDWHRTFVEPGYGVSCDPASVASLEAAIRWLHENPESRVRMGAAGRERILTEWNYETAFAPVLETMLGTAGAQA